VQSVCDECPRSRRSGPLRRLERRVRTRSRACLLERGILCCGPVSPAGCGALCPGRGAPCIGCTFPSPDAHAFEAAVLGSLASRFRRGRVVDRCIEAGLQDPIGRLREYQQARLLLWPLVRAGRA
jgi:coenzyme F420-reducing hydrogenase gamma subunit